MDSAPIATTSHTFVLPDAYPFVGGGEKDDGVVFHLEFPRYVLPSH